MEITKELLIKKLYSLVKDYEVGGEKVRAMDVISAIKQISVMKGFNEPEKREVINKNYTLDF